MIYTQDLRIGDLVRYGKDVISIQAVHADGLVCFADGKDQICVEQVLLEPIPLTPEILEENGFNVIDPEKCYTKPIVAQKTFFARYLSIENKPNGWKVFIKYENFSDNVLARPIKYIHEFQNLLWALGLNANLKI